MAGLILLVLLLLGACAVPAPTVVTPPSYKPGVAPCERPCSVTVGRATTWYGDATVWETAK